MKFLALLALALSAAATTVSEINGAAYLSPLKDKTVSNVRGVVTATGPNGFWIRAETQTEGNDALYVFTKDHAAVGDCVSIAGKVLEYRSSNAYLYLTELAPTNITVLSSGHAVSPRVIGVDTLPPPTEEYSSLDGGDVYALPNGVARVSAKNPTLQPAKYGLDFWESLVGELVSIRAPGALGRGNRFGDTWVVGDWKATGANAHGGLSMTSNDSNPEAILVGSPLDGSANPADSKMGDGFADITGVVTYAFGFYRILPLSGLQRVSSADAAAGPTTLRSAGHCKGVTVGSYNVENLEPNSAHLPRVAAHIADFLLSPDIMFIQEVQDDSGPENDGTVAANATLNNLVKAIAAAGGAQYAWTEIVPANNEDGGQPGGNIRVAYLYNPAVVELVPGPRGGPNDANAVVKDAKGLPALKYNPGRIAPSSPAWAETRKPVAAMWRARASKTPFFTVNVHFSSKGGSTSLHGDVRPPTNGAVEKRTLQAQVTAEFIKSILDVNKNAAVIAAGDFNEFSFVGPMKTFAAVSGLVDLDAAVGIPPVERYSYSYDMNAQELDHFFVSPALAAAAGDKGKGKDRTDRTTSFEHLHLSTWQDEKGMVSDHDPAVAKFDVCK